jgi:hypothetical protein
VAPEGIVLSMHVLCCYCDCSGERFCEARSPCATEVTISVRRDRAGVGKTFYGLGETSFWLLAAALVRASFHCFIVFGSRAHRTPFSSGAPYSSGWR